MIRWTDKGFQAQIVLRKQGYNAYLQTPWWKGRLNAYLRRNRLCRGCYDQPAQCLHHLTYKTLAREKARDVIPMCHSCHQKLHDAINARFGDLRPAENRLSIRYETIWRKTFNNCTSWLGKPTPIPKQRSRIPWYRRRQKPPRLSIDDIVTEQLRRHAAEKRAEIGQTMETLQ